MGDFKFKIGDVGVITHIDEDDDWMPYNVQFSNGCVGWYTEYELILKGVNKK